MKKISVLSACLLMCATSFGQTQVVKDAENALKKGAYYNDVVKVITPAFSDPSTSGLAQTYFIPGKAGFNTFDEMLKLATVGQLPQNGEKLRSEALIGGYEYLMKALPLDSIPDEKGKVKPKYSKEIFSIIGGHHSDFSNVGVDFWNAEDWNNAYLAWDIYCSLPNDKRFAKAITYMPADSTIAEMMYNRSLAAYQSGDMAKTLKSFLEAKDKGYHKKTLYDYAIAAAYQLGDKAAVKALCEEALPIYGNEDTRYIRQLINDHIENKDYNGAIQMINQAIASEPDNAQYYIIRGILYEQDGVNGDSKAEFQKAVALDGTNAEALYNLGRTIFNEAVRLDEQAPATDAGEYAKFKAAQILPVLNESINYLEQAWEADNDNKDALKLLEQAYYLTEDDSNLKYTQDRLAY